MADGQGCLNKISVKRDQNFGGMWVLPGFSKEKRIGRQMSDPPRVGSCAPVVAPNILYSVARRMEGMQIKKSARFIYRSPLRCIRLNGESWET